MSEKIDSPIFPVVSWRMAVGNAPAGKVTFLEVGYAKSLSETRASLPGRPPPHTVPLGLTSQQCRDLAADLIEAAGKIDGGSTKR